MKRINITPQMFEAMKISFDDTELNQANYYVFETVAVTTRPLVKAGTIFNNAVITASTLDEMASQVNSQGGFVPLILQHDRAGPAVTPSGKVFRGEVYTTEDGLAKELRVLFAMPNPETDGNAVRAQHTRDVDSGLISEVSIGAAFKQLLSSASPTFDWFGSDGDIAKFYGRVDDKGNSIDAGETHGIAKGLRTWTELSLVVRGASTGATISSSSKQKLSKQFEDSGMFRKLAANADFDIADLVTFSPSTQKTQMKKKATTPKGDFKMDAELILSQLADKGAEVGQLTVKLGVAETQVTELTASTTTLTTANTELTAANATLTTEVATLTAQLADAPAESVAAVAEVTAFLDTQLAAAITASGKSDVKTDGMTTAQKVAFIKETGVALHQLHGSESGAAGTNTPSDADQARKMAFLKANRG